VTVVDVTIHLAGQGNEQRSLPAVPSVGTLLDIGGQLLRVAVVVMGQSVDVYAIRADETLAAELAGWGDKPAAVVEPAGQEQQKGLFQ
jgi:hypothetical protein